MKKSAFLILLALILIPSAQAADSGSKENEFSLGLAAYGKKDYQAACEHFRKYMAGRSPDQGRLIILLFRTCSATA